MAENDAQPIAQVPTSTKVPIATTATLAASQAALDGEPTPTTTEEVTAKPKRSTRRKKANPDA